MRKSRLIRAKQNRLIELVVAGSTARTVASLVGVNKTTSSYYSQCLGQRIYEHSDDAGFLEGEVEIDENYLGGRGKGKRGRGAAGKVPVFRLLKRNGRACRVIILDVKTATLLFIIREKVRPGSIISLS